MKEPDAKSDFLRSRAFRECFVVFFVVGLIGIFIMAALAPAQRRPKRITCTNHLKQIGLGLRLYANDNSDQFPMQISTNSSTGGSREWVGTTNVFRHFQAASNELGSSKILACPADNQRIVVQSFSKLDN